MQYALKRRTFTATVKLANLLRRSVQTVSLFGTKCLRCHRRPHIKNDPNIYIYSSQTAHIHQVYALYAIRLMFGIYRKLVIQQLIRSKWLHK